MRSLQQPAPQPLTRECQNVVNEVAAIAASPARSPAEALSLASISSQMPGTGPSRDAFVKVLLASGVIDADEWARLAGRRRRLEWSYVLLRLYTLRYPDKSPTPSSPTILAYI